MAIHLAGPGADGSPPLDATVPDGALIAIIGEDEQSHRQLLRQTAVRYFDADSRDALLTLEAMPGDNLAIDHALGLLSPLNRELAIGCLGAARRADAAIAMATHDLDLASRIADEVWWIESGQLRESGDPGQVVESFRRYLTARLREQLASRPGMISPTLRRGDGRAEIVSLEMLDAQGNSTQTAASDDPLTIRLVVRFHGAVSDPVVGIMIRTRIGFEVYGTNTELERLPLGPAVPGDLLQIDFHFECRLCPQEYTLTAASHDPDGVWHDWMEDAIGFRVTDSRYTAGVANLRAKASAMKRSHVPAT